MPIERITFPFGLPLKGPDAESEIIKAFQDNYSRKKILPEDEYTLTSTGPRFLHNLIVFADGTALYRAIPQLPEVATITLSKERVEGRLGGRIIRIPEDQDIFALTGDLGEDSYGLFELIFSSDAINRLDTIDKTIIVSQNFKNQ